MEKGFSERGWTVRRVRCHFPVGGDLCSWTEGRRYASRALSFVFWADRFWGGHAARGRRLATVLRPGRAALLATARAAVAPTKAAPATARTHPPAAPVGAAALAITPVVPRPGRLPPSPDPGRPSPGARPPAPPPTATVS